MLPGMDGYELCRLSLEVTVPVLFLSAQAPSWTRWWAWEIGGDDWQREPFGVRGSSHASAPCCAADRAATSRP